MEAPSRAVAERLGAQVRDELARALAASRRVVLANFQNSENLGDAAIWAGAARAFSDIGADVALAVGRNSYRRDVVARELGPDGVLAIHGGGSFGDVWPAEQRFRERLIADFPDARVLQLPQSIHFSDPRARERCAGVLAAHGGVILMVRDHPSQAEAAAFAGDVRLVPDTAFALGPQARPEPVRPLVWLLRTDHERARDADVEGSIDWPAERGARGLPRNVAGALGRIAGRTSLRTPHAALGRSYDGLARRRLATAVAILGEGERVVTDRLHAHILCVLLGIPHVVLDNSYGKLSRLRDAWTGAAGGAAWASSLEEAREMVSAP